MEKTAFVAIVGRPNVGKSSILNKLLKHKIAIVSNKPQTTRTRIMGVLTEGECQLVFIDTPGLHKPRTDLGKYMVRAINESVSGVDACLLVVDPEKSPAETELSLIEKFKAMGIPAILAINKIDTVEDKAKLMPVILKYSELFDFEAIVPMSAIDGNGVNDLKKELMALCQEGVHMFEDDTLTDQSERVLAAEMIREKILRNTDKEIPHGTAVVVEKMRQREDTGILDIDATIYCEKATHKGIIIGKGGNMLKKISTLARQDMERFFECKVNLHTWIKVKEDWRNRDFLLRSFGFDSNDFE